MKVKRSHKPTLIAPVVEPFQEFLHAEFAGGLFLLAGSAIALIWANSPWSAGYQAVWQTPLSVGAGDVALSKPLSAWINDGLMAMFFFVVGLEIKREFLAGELSSFRQAILPMAAALGGMILPALIYVAVNWTSEGKPGWGIPVATDIAFSLGILSMMGRRVPLSLKIFLAALAIIDDLGAVLVIALFYTSDISLVSLGFGGLFLAVLIGANLVGIRHALFYALIGIGGVWLAFLLSGIHPTIAGVLAAWTIPARRHLGSKEFLTVSRRLLAEFQRKIPHGRAPVTDQERHRVTLELEQAIKETDTPLQRLEHALNPWVTGIVLPVFALANAGVTFEGNLVEHLQNTVTIGVVCGLLLGKPLGVVGAVWLAIRAGLGALPSGTTWRHMIGVGWLAGIGFTMSLFIGELAFGDAPLLTTAKIGVLFGSIAAGLVGWLVLHTCPKTP